MDCSGSNGECIKYKENRIVRKCSDSNCESCKFQDGIETCIECKENYILSDDICQRNNNVLIIIICVLVFVILIMGVIIGRCIYRKKRRNFNVERNDGIINLPQIYDRNNEGTMRDILTKEDLIEEFEIQSKKMEKGNELCCFCNKKAGKFKCDCGCIVCKEHSELKNIEKDGKRIKVCFKCEKVVNQVNLIKYDCHICMEKNNVVAHFRCGCSLEVCQNCYVKSKLNSNKCPGCRAII